MTQGKAFVFVSWKISALKTVLFLASSPFCIEMEENSSKNHIGWWFHAAFIFEVWTIMTVVVSMCCWGNVSSLVFPFFVCDRIAYILTDELWGKFRFNPLGFGADERRNTTDLDIQNIIFDRSARVWGLGGTSAVPFRPLFWVAPSHWLLGL